jgi:hypothetical protein
MSLVEGPLKASDLFIKALSNENITHIFAVPGTVSDASALPSLLQHAQPISGVIETLGHVLPLWYWKTHSTIYVDNNLCRGGEPGPSGVHPEKRHKAHSSSS